ncbi:hypothetical protein BC826DRAFT_1058269 [Russula brevipes]|nr:hypothetical protein BC826DRAFT_1058269 [Russula brevipes]
MRIWPILPESTSRSSGGLAWLDLLGLSVLVRAFQIVPQPSRVARPFLQPRLVFNSTTPVGVLDRRSLIGTKCACAFDRKIRTRKPRQE